MTPVLEFTNVRRAFRSDAPILDGLSFSIGREEIVGLLGRNGTGKTTLIHLAMGMLFPHHGTVRAFGLAPTERPVEVKRRIGYVAEDQVLPGSWKIGELVAFHRHIFPTWDAQLEQQLLARFGLAANTQQIVKLSKGQARQVALICAVCHRPELLILDEPGGGLDPAARREFLETSIQLLNREGTTILFSSHHMGDVERLGGRVMFLDGGKIRLDRELDALREEYCVAIVNRSELNDQAALERVAGCVRVRAVLNEWHAVFEGSAEVIRQRLIDTLGMADARCVSVPLEELFVELLGGERLVTAS